MGRSGIRRRKQRHPLPKVRSEDADFDEDVPPTITWPSRDSGFEASAYSPAGTHQRLWWFVRGVSDESRRISKARLRMARLLLAAVALVFLGGPVSMFLAWLVRLVT